MAITARRYYFRPDSNSAQLLPGLFRINQRDINGLIAVDQSVLRQLDELRRQDPETKGAQKELDTLKQLSDDYFAEIRQEGDTLLKYLRERNHTMAKLDGAQDRYTEYKETREKVSKDRAEKMEVFQDSIQYLDRYFAAKQVVAKANKRDQTELLKTQLKDAKHLTSKEYCHYHQDDYAQNGLQQARATTMTGKVDFRKFQRGYGTNLPSTGTIATGHAQNCNKFKGGVSSRRYTVAELRAGATNRVIKKMGWPEQKAWDTTRPKHLRKPELRGPVSLVIMGHRIEGSCLFHQAVPEDYCVVDIRIAVEVRGGNRHFYLVLTMEDMLGSQSRQKANSFDSLLESLDGDDAKRIGKLKGQLTKKITSMENGKKGEHTLERLQDWLIACDERIEELRTIKELEKNAARETKRLAKEQSKSIKKSNMEEVV